MVDIQKNRGKTVSNLDFPRRPKICTWVWIYSTHTLPYIALKNHSLPSFELVASSVTLRRDVRAASCVDGTYMTGDKNFCRLVHSKDFLCVFKTTCQTRWRVSGLFSEQRVSPIYLLVALVVICRGGISINAGFRCFCAERTHDNSMK